MSPLDAKRIVVRAPNWMGDVVMAAAIFARIRAGFPAASITCAARPNLLALLAGSPLFDASLELPHRRGWGRIASFWRQVRAVRAGRFDLAIVLPNSPSSGWVMRLAGVPMRLGYRQGRPFAMNFGLHAEQNRGLLQKRYGPRRVPTPMPEYWGRLLDVIGLPPGPTGPALHASAAETAWVDGWLRDHDIAPDAPLVLLNPGANFGPSKLWVGARWVELARHHRSQGLVPLFLAGPNDTELVPPLAAAAGAEWALLPLDKLKGLVGRARLVVSTDTGPRHLAVAMHVPAVCLMGPNDARYTNFALDRQVVLQKDLPCVPCQRKVCPLGHHDCMRSITVGEVVAAGDRLLGRQDLTSAPGRGPMA